MATYLQSKELTKASLWITKKKQSILWNKSTIVGASILELSKLFMLNFHYNVKKREKQCLLLYSDADSFVYTTKKVIFITSGSQFNSETTHWFFQFFHLSQVVWLIERKAGAKIQWRASQNPHWTVLCIKTKVVFISCRWAEQYVCQRHKKFAQLKLNH